MDKNLKDYNKMIDETFLGLWKQRRKTELSKKHFANFPIKQLDISEIYDILIATDAYDATTKREISDKLIDIKTLYFFLDNSLERFYLGATLIVGNGELYKVDEKTISLIQHNHYKVYLISCLYEKLLDFFQLIYFGTRTDPKRDKWRILFKELSKKPDFDFISSEDNAIMLNFRDKVRNIEIHGISTVIRQLYKDKWDHFQIEEEVVKKVSQKLYIKFKTVIFL